MEFYLFNIFCGLVLQINANPNQDAIIMHSIGNTRKYQIQSILGFAKIFKNCQIQPLGSIEIYDVNILIINQSCYVTILATSNGLAFLYVMNLEGNSSKFLVYNPITKECIEIHHLQALPFDRLCYDTTCQFLEHDLQSSSIKYFLLAS